MRLFFVSLLSLSTTLAWANFNSAENPLDVISQNGKNNSFNPAAKLASQNSAQPTTPSNKSFATVDQAFDFNFIQQGDRVKLSWKVLDGYYLYQERFDFSSENAEIGPPVVPDGTPHQDEFFGEVHIYTDTVSVEIPLKSVADGGNLIVSYQGCAKTGFCYPPERRVIPLDQLDANSTSAVTSSQTQAPEQEQATQTNTAAPTQDASQPASTQAQDASFAAHLGENWWTPFLFLLLGVGLAFTPCVLPMYPILTGIVLGGGRQSAGHAFKLSFVYVQGMALTYTLLGLVVASLGVQFQAALQSPTVLISLSVLFVVLALSMFGVYNLQLPSSLQTKLNNLSNQQKGGNLIGVFAMGAISGLVCSPCTTAPLSGALLYVAQSGDLVTGAIALYALAIGMGIPLILVAVFGNKLLPRAGEWMNIVKVGFGFILLAAPIFLLERILPQQTAHLLWAGLGLASFGWLYHVKSSKLAQSWRQSLVGIIAILGLVASMQLALNATGIVQTTATQQVKTQQISFERIKTVDDLDQALANAKQAGKPVMLDFYADWCVACKEFEKYTFHTPEVEQKLKDFVLIQADVTQGDEADIALMQRLKVLGLPTIEFWDASGEHKTNARISGFIEADVFLQHLTNNQL
ncbi:MAG: protein-disulfide reductase DsbD [Vibrio sp.]